MIFFVKCQTKKEWKVCRHHPSTNCGDKVSGRLNSIFYVMPLNVKASQDACSGLKSAFAFKQLQETFSNQQHF